MNKDGLVSNLDVNVLEAEYNLKGDCIKILIIKKAFPFK
jgi:hypothetical protein